MRGSIQEMYNNIKSLLQDDSLYLGLILVLVGVTSFGLGRWSVIYSQPESSAKSAELRPQKSPTEGIIATTKERVPVASVPPVAELVSARPEGETTYVASKSGSKYHLLWCSGAKTIKEENKIYFKSKEEAQKAGYTPAANCKDI